MRLKIFFIFFFQPFGNLARSETFGILCKRDSLVAKHTWVLRQRCRHCWMMKTNHNCQTNRGQQLVLLHFYHLFLVFHQEPWFIWALKAWAPDLKSARGWRGRALYGWGVGWLGAFQSCSTLPGWQWNITWLGCALRADIWVKTRGHPNGWLYEKFSFVASKRKRNLRYGISQTKVFSPWTF